MIHADQEVRLPGAHLKWPSTRAADTSFSDTVDIILVGTFRQMCLDCYISVSKELHSVVCLNCEGIHEAQGFT